MASQITAASLDFGETVLVLGDMHIPHRQESVPAPLKELLSHARVNHIIVTGNVCDKETVDWLRSLAPNVHLVKGDLDFYMVPGANEAVDQKTLMIAGWRFCVLHGHQIVPWGDTAALLNIAHSTDADILVHGHTHQSSALVDRSAKPVLLVNPGSASGAYSSTVSSVTPSFQALALRPAACTVFTYSLSGNDVSVSKVEHVRKSA